MRMQAQTKNLTGAAERLGPMHAHGVLQRKCACGQHTIAGGSCEACREKRLQRGGTARAGEVPPEVQEVLRSEGQPLDSPTRAFMESRFHHDFSNVRVHADERAADSARGVNALAYTVGQDVVFGAGQYSPSTREGQRLLAHELTHVVQQRSAPRSGLARKVTLDSSLPLEAEADRTADRVLAGQTVSLRSTGSRAAGHSLQRQPAPAGAAAKKDVDEEKKPGSKTEEPEAKKEQGAHAGGCIEEVVGRDPDSLARMDTMTVVELGSPSCDGCRFWLSDLSELCSEFAAKPQRVRFRVYSINQDLDENEEVVKRIKQRTKVRTIPQVFVYTDREQVAFYDKYVIGADNIGPVRKIYKAASTPGAVTGAKWGAIIGGIAGTIAGGIVGGFLGGFGGVLAGGLVGGIAAGAVGAGLGAAIGAIFGNQKGISPLSEKRLKEVREYMYGVQNEKGEVVKNGLHQEKAIRGESDSDDLARDVVDQWVNNPQAFPLDILDRRLLIMEMLDGYLSTADQRAILKVLENSTDTEVLQIVNLVGRTSKDRQSDGFSFADLKARFSGDELKYLEKITEGLRADFPVDPPLAKTEGLLISRGETKSRMKAAYELAQKQSGYSEVAGLFMDSGNPDSPHYHEQLFKGTTSFMWDVYRAAAQKFGKGKAVLGSFHTHPLTEGPSAGRSAPSASDLKNAVDNPMMGKEHYVIDPWVVYLITKKGGLVELGRTDAMLGVKPPPVPKGMTSTLEL